MIMRKPKRKISTIFSVMFWSLIAASLLILLIRAIPGSDSYIPFKSFIVQSGSMEPSIMTGDLLVVMPQPAYNLNDVVTFRGDEERIVTHRIREIQPGGASSLFVTQGDANRSVDAAIILPEAVIGKVVLTLPKLGFVANFSRSPLGIMLMIIIPATLIVNDELRGLFRGKS